MTLAGNATESAAKTLWYTRCPVPSPLGLAARQGWLDDTFAAEGFAIASILDSPVAEVRESHFDHHLAWSFRQGGNIPALWARANGRRTRLIGLTWTDEFQAVITLPETGIATARDLVGRRFGIPRRLNDQVDFHRATALKGMVSALAADGLPASTVDIVDIDIAEKVLVKAGDPALAGLRRRHPYWHELKALGEGKVDAIFVKGAEGITVANLVAAVIVTEFGRHPDPAIRINNGPPRTLTIDAALADERPDLAARLVALVARAGAWAAAHPEETLRFVAREILTSEDAVIASNGPDLHTRLGIGLDPAHVAAIGQFKRFLIEWGFLTADFDLDHWIDPGPLAAAGLAAAA